MTYSSFSDLLFDNEFEGDQWQSSAGGEASVHSESV